MSTILSTRGASMLTRTRMVDIVIPVFNEQADLERSVGRLDEFLRGERFPWGYRITIADNASTDDTWVIAQRLAADASHIHAVHLDRKGRGRALKAVWLASDADVLAYMDVDLSTDLKALIPLVAPLISGHSDVSIGSRLARSSRVARGPKREFISRSYNLILRAALAAGFSDAQCGFKAIRSDIAHRLLPLVEDDNWFFDTELLVLAERCGLRIHEVPVDWTDDPGTTVDILATATEDLRGIWRLSRGLARRRIPIERLAAELVRPDTTPVAPGVPRGLTGQLLRFGLVGVASTLAYFAIYLALRPALDAQTSNLIALLVTAIANTATNRIVTFHVHGTRRLLRDHLGGLAAFGLGLALTSGSLWLLHHTHQPPSRGLEVLVLIIANALATLFRFIALRQMMHHRGRH